MTTPTFEGTLSPRDIARLEEGRQAVAIGEIAFETAPFVDGAMCYSAPGSWSNTAVGVGFERSPSEDELAAFVNWYVSRGVEPRIELHPFVAPEFLSLLAARNFTLRNFEHTLAFPLRGLWPEATPAGASLPRSWAIVRLDPTDVTLVERLAQFQARGFLPAGTEPDEPLLETIRRAFCHPRATTFLAIPKGGSAADFVASASMECTGAVAALYGAVVGEHHRRQGLQQALIRHRLEEGRQRGCLVATIGSKPGIPTERNALRLGFHVAYTKVALAMAGEGLVPTVS